jgi:hypothetical protein
MKMPPAETLKRSANSGSPDSQQNDGLTVSNERWSISEREVKKMQAGMTADIGRTAICIG